MGLAPQPGLIPVNAFTNDPPTGGIYQIGIRYNITGFISTPASYGTSVNVDERFGFAYITFQRMYGSYAQLTLYYHTSNGTAISGVDYTGVSGTVVWAFGDTNPKTVAVPILVTTAVANSFFNFVVEGVQLGTAFFHTVYVFTGGSLNPFPGPHYASNGTTFPVTIVRQGHGQLVFSGTPYSVTRPGGTTTVTLQVQRIYGSKGAIGCSFHTTGGTAVDGVAFTGQTGTLSWAVNDIATKNITITILSGGSGTQSFTVTIDTPTGGTTIGTPGVATVNIVAAAPPANPVSTGGIPNQIIDNGDTDDVTNDAVTVQPMNILIQELPSVIGRNILCNSFASSAPRVNFNGTFWFSTTVGWIVGDGGWILGTSDGGATWTVQSSGTNQNLYDVFFADASNGWAVGAAGTILVTANGGSTWTPQTSGVSTALYGVSFISTSTGLIVGASGVILRTTNGGGAWSSQTSGVATPLNEVHYFDATHAWAGGDSGVILFSANGTAWGTQTSGVATDLNGIYFASTTIGWAVGDSGVIRTTSNGGTTWTPQTSSTTQNLFDVNFQSTTVGWAVGANGKILATTNGSTWATQTSGVTVSLNSIDAASTSIAYAVGNGATFLATGNGGATWVLTPAPSPIGADIPTGSSFGGGGDFFSIDDSFTQSLPLRFGGSQY